MSNPIPPQNFSIDRKIGKGQFSVVYRAVCTSDERTVALKKVQMFEMVDAKARLDCMKEIQLLQVLFTLLMVYKGLGIWDDRDNTFIVP